MQETQPAANRNLSGDAGISRPLVNAPAPKKSTGKKISAGAYVAADGAVALLKQLEKINDPSGASAVAGVILVLVEQVILARANKQQLAFLSQRAQAVTPFLQRISKTQSQHNIAAALRSFKEVVEACIQQAMKYSKKSYARKLLRAGTDQENFTQLNTRLNEAIGQLDLGLSIEMVVMQEQNLVHSLADKREIMTNVTQILEQQKQLLEKNLEPKNQKQDLMLAQQDRDAVLAQQVQSMFASLADKLALDNKEKHDFLQMEYKKLQQEKRFSGINTDPGQPKPPINSKLLIPFHEIEIENKIAVGSFGSIYQGIWCEIPVVVKKIGRNLNKKDYEQFVREAKIMAQLRNPYITQLYGACMEPEACLVMEYMEQGSLDKLIEKKTLTHEEKKRLALDIAKGLLYLHSREVLHRDLKTSNILINSQGQAKLTDFGLSKTADLKVKTIMERSDAIQWMPPETFLMNPGYTSESDIYSYGMVLWSICTGKKPYANISEFEIPEKISKGECEVMGDDVPSDFQSIIKKCWSKSAADRPSLSKIIADLKKMENQEKLSLSATAFFDQGLLCEQKRDYPSAVTHYRLAADMGLFRAQANLGTCYLNGTGVSQDKKQAFDWILKAAQQGHGRSQYNVAAMLERGDGVTQDAQEALRWYREAAKQNMGDSPKKVQELERLCSGSGSIQRGMNK